MSGILSVLQRKRCGEVTSLSPPRQWFQKPAAYHCWSGEKLNNLLDDLKKRPKKTSLGFYLLKYENPRYILHTSELVGEIKDMSLCIVTDECAYCPENMQNAVEISTFLEAYWWLWILARRRTKFCWDMHIPQSLLGILKEREKKELERIFQNSFYPVICRILKPHPLQ